MKWIVCLLALSAVSCGIAEVVEPAGGGGASGVPEPSDGKYPVEINLGETTRLTGDGTAWTDGDYIGVSVDGVAGQTIFRYNGTTGAWEGGYSATGFVSRLYWPDANSRTVTAWYPFADGRSPDQLVLRGTGTGNYKTPANIQMAHQTAYVRVNITDPAYSANSEILVYARTYSYSKGVVAIENDEERVYIRSGDWTSCAPGSFLYSDWIYLNIVDQSNNGARMPYVPNIRTVEAGKVYDINISLPPHYAVGDIYPKTGTPIGVVVETYIAGFSGIIVSLDEITTQWSTQTWVDGVEEGYVDLNDVQRVNPDFSLFPAYKWVDAKNPPGVDYSGVDRGRWYMPSYSEMLRLLLRVRDGSGNLLPFGEKINEALVRAGGTPISAGVLYGTDRMSSSYTAQVNSNSDSYSWVLKTTPTRYRALMLLMEF